MSSGEITPEQEIRVRQALANVPFAKLLRIELESCGAGSAVLAMNLREELRQNNGVVHGGAIASLIDSATAIAILTQLAPDERVTTVDLTISFLRPLIAGRAQCNAKVIRAGSRLISVSAEVFADNGSLSATALSTYIKLRSR